MGIPHAKFQGQVWFLGVPHVLGHSSAAISAYRQWVATSMYALSSPMYHHILGRGYPILHMCFTWSIFQASLLSHLQVFAYF
jgi:hypothetical protein